MSKGYQKGHITSKETRKKIADKLRGNKNGLGHVVSSETKKVLSLSKLGSNNPQFGKPSWNKGKKLSFEYRQKLSLAHKGLYTGEKNHFWKHGNGEQNRTERQRIRIAPKK